MQSISLRSFRFAIAVLLTLAVAQSARAASTSAGAEIEDYGLSDFGSESASVDVVIVGDSYQASASVAYGSLAARARYDVPEFSGSLGFGPFATASAQALDVITITGGSGAGTLVVTFRFSGSSAESHPEIVRGEYLFYANTPSNSFSRSRNVHGLVDGLVVRDPIPFVFGEPFSLSLGLNLAIEQIAEGPPPPYAPLEAGFGYDEIVWAGSAVFDAQAQPVSGFGISSESGTAYPVTTVPESGANALALASLGALARRAASTGSARSASRA